MTERVSIAECREILGEFASGLTDDQVLRLRDDLERIASALYDEISRRAHTTDGADGIRWAAFLHTCTQEEGDEALDDSQLWAAWEAGYLP